MTWHITTEICPVFHRN